MKRTFPAKVIEEEQRVIMTTAAAQAPAPGKLEFKDDYTPDEAERVIRNSKGLPVGVRPKMVWTWKKALLWAAIAIVCACGWAILAVSRGEQISAIWFLVVALSSYAIAYRFYAYYIQIKIMRTDDANATPAERVHDGANFERTDRRSALRPALCRHLRRRTARRPDPGRADGLPALHSVDHPRRDFRRRRARTCWCCGSPPSAAVALWARWPLMKWVSSAV